MIGRKLLSFLRQNPLPQSSSAKLLVEEPKSKTWARRLISGSLICLTGGVALSALDDLAIFYACSSKGMEKASKNKALIEAIGEPIVRGPWYNASLAVTHRRHSVSCSFPVSGPQGNGIFQLRAVRNGDENWLSLFWPRNWEILIMEALLHVPENNEKNQTFRISISDSLSPPPGCTTCNIQESDAPEKKQLRN